MLTLRVRSRSGPPAGVVTARSPAGEVEAPPADRQSRGPFCDR
ncbi:hypothetical protein EV562_11252 [Streptomyces sp. BK208]|nr:hypothetical protein EV562_11252 [Streptomyces sp. BK208]